MPAFSSPIDCTPWVIGGLWPAELSTITAENATLADYLKVDLEKIADSANEQLKMIKRAGLADVPRRAEEARVIDEARARAVRRVESTIRQLHAGRAGVTAGYPRSQFAEPVSPDMHQTQVIPTVMEAGPVPDVPVSSVRRPRWRVADKPAPVAPPQGGGDQPEAPPQDTAFEHEAVEVAVAPDIKETQVIPSVTELEEPATQQDEAERAPDADVGDDPASIAETQIIPKINDVEPALAAESAATSEWEPVGRHHAAPEEPAPDEDEAQPEPAEHHFAAAAMEETQIIPAITRAEHVVDESARPPQRENNTAATGFDIDRLNRLLEFVVRQEPRLNWAVGDFADGTTVLVTDLAHGWIPAGINLPAGVRLLEPERRTGRVAALIADAVRVVAYAPGDSLRRSADFTATKSSVEPRELPAIADLSRVLSETTRGFDGLPRIVQRLADAAAADGIVIDQEVDVLRVHLDTARYQLLVQYPNVNPALLLKCLLMAATEGIASGDSVAANYHLAWYQKLAAQPHGA